MRIRDLMLGLSAIAVGCASLYFLVPAYTKQRRVTIEVEQLRETVARQEEEIRGLNREIASLRDDPRAVERVAREKFGWCSEGESIIHFDAPREAVAPARP